MNKPTALCTISAAVVFGAAGCVQQSKLHQQHTEVAYLGDERRPAAVGSTAEPNPQGSAGAEVEPPTSSVSNPRRARTTLPGMRARRGPHVAATPEPWGTP